MTINITCRSCSKGFSVTAPTEGIERWRSGELIQRALPSLSSAERELLISQICEPCFDALFEDTE